MSALSGETLHLFMGMKKTTSMLLTTNHTTATYLVLVVEVEGITKHLLTPGRGACTPHQIF